MSITEPRLVPDGLTPDRYLVLDLVPYRDIDGEIIIERRKSGWRCYLAMTMMSYSTSFGHGGGCSHERLRAIKCDLTGRPLLSQRSPQEAFVKLVREYQDGCLLPVGA